MGDPDQSDAAFGSGAPAGETRPRDPLTARPRRRIVLLAKIEADSWRDLQGELMDIATEIARDGKLSTTSVSGGYSGGHVVVTSEDGAIDHDTWARELEAYLEALRAREEAAK